MPAGSELAPLEIATGVVLGTEPAAPRLPVVPGELHPRRAFEDVVRHALERPPCVVTFSGGRDSSTVLAVAMRVARREGLPLPVAVTLRMLDTPGSGEQEWQERVATAVRLDDWVRIEVGAEDADYVGPVARELLLRHGLADHAWVRLMIALQIEHARGGSMLTGMSGDAATGGWLPAHAAEVLAGHAGLRVAELPLLAYAGTPTWARRRVLRFGVKRPPWLTRAAAQAYAADVAGERASHPARWDRYQEWRLRLRRSSTLALALSPLASDAGVQILHPFADPRFAAALARLGGRRGLGDRTRVMRTVFPTELPDEALARSSKALFLLAHFRSPSRDFAGRWDGAGFDPELLDPEALRQAWLSPLVPPASTLAIQHAWLHSARRGLEQLPADVL